MARIAGVNIPTAKRVPIALQYIHGIGAFDFLDRWLRPEVASSREFAAWGTVTQELTENPGSWIAGRFRVGSKNPRFKGLQFRAESRGSGAVTVRYGSKRGMADVGSVTARLQDGWAVAAVPERALDSGREYWFELRATGTFVLTGPKPLGGARFVDEFAVAYKPIKDSSAQ